MPPVCLTKLTDDIIGLVFSTHQRSRPPIQLHPISSSPWWLAATMPCAMRKRVQRTIGMLLRLTFSRSPWTQR